MYYEKNADLDGYLRFSKRTPKRDGELIATPHFHNSIELYVCLKGQYCVYLGGEKKIISAGEIAFVDRHILHTAGSIKTDEDTVVYFIIASNYYLNGIKWLEEETIPPFTKRKEGFDDIVKVVELASSMEKAMNEEMRRGFITLLFGMLKNYCGTAPRVASKNNELIVRVMQYIEEHLSENITLELLSREFGYEKSYFSRVFNKYLGMNLREYLNRSRISEVNRIRQQSPTLPISKVWESCGFDSPNTFYRAYNKYGAQKHNF